MQQMSAILWDTTKGCLMLKINTRVRVVWTQPSADCCLGLAKIMGVKIPRVQREMSCSIFSDKNNERKQPETATTHACVEYWYSLA